jgi:hypothetical protein
MDEPADVLPGAVWGGEQSDSAHHFTDVSRDGDMDRDRDIVAERGLLVPRWIRTWHILGVGTVNSEACTRRESPFRNSYWPSPSHMATVSTLGGIYAWLCLAAVNRRSSGRCPPRRCCLSLLHEQSCERNGLVAYANSALLLVVSLDGKDRMLDTFACLNSRTWLAHSQRRGLSDSMRKVRD